jgi:hypothetical protein
MIKKTHNRSFVVKPKKKYISKLDMINTLDITNEIYTLCMVRAYIK